MTRSMTGLESSVGAAIVNYGTPDLTRAAIWSLHSTYPDMPITVVDNNSPDASVQELQRLLPSVPPLRLIANTRNVHHGPGLDMVIHQADKEWILIFDSDCLLYRPGLIESMLNRAAGDDAYMIGQLLKVDPMGYQVDPSTVNGEAYCYVHPKCALVKRSLYLRLPPFEKHGVPCLTNEKAAAARGYQLIDFPVDEYVYHIGRGTAGRHGYRLGVKGWIWEIRHRLKWLPE